MGLQSYLRVCMTAMVGVAASLLLSSAHAQDKYQQIVPVSPAPKTIKVEINVETLEYKVVEPAGARPCSLCTAKLEAELGKGCEKAAEKKINICQGLVNATVQDVNHIILLRSHKNPFCFSIVSGNYGGTDIVQQLCICGPGENCPAPAWYQ